jgi:uncharacterized protein (UPF0332 family)
MHYFYVVSALLVQEGHKSKTHDGTQQIFGREYVRTGVIPRAYGKAYSQLFRLRQAGDYGDLEDVTMEDLSRIRPEIEELIELVKQLITSND